MAFDVNKHHLVPKHMKLNDSEKKKLLLHYSITTKELPKILVKDPAIQNLKPKVGDIIKIERESKTAGVAFYYRSVVEG